MLLLLLLLLLLTLLTLLMLVLLLPPVAASYTNTTDRAHPSSVFGFWFLAKDGMV